MKNALPDQSACFFELFVCKVKSKPKTQNQDFVRQIETCISNLLPGFRCPSVYFRIGFKLLRYSIVASPEV